ALMLAPTRELAVQIHKDAEALCKHTDFTTAAVYGGTGYDQQRDLLLVGNHVADLPHFLSGDLFWLHLH
ncbi:hypothetical protein QQ73_09675, partial [Candidatus Endoriftia persephone str. Guaymas]|nr:hypothetical protein [Candidatus Endoriftia persephone str. Guaymas]